MAFTIAGSSRYGWVRPNFNNEEDTNCGDEIAVCLPVYALSDLKFQLLVYITGDDRAHFETSYEGEVDNAKNTILAKVCDTCGNFPYDETYQLEVLNPEDLDLMNWSATWTKLVAQSTVDQDVWIGNFTYTGNSATFTDYVEGGCFFMCFYLCQVAIAAPKVPVIIYPTLLGCSGYCFHKISGPCDTSLFSYRCNEDSFGFMYKDFPSFFNSVRLPCLLKNMQLTSEENSYMKSDGRYIKLSERIEEEYELVTAPIPKHWHKKLKVLLAHDTISILNENERGVSAWPIVCREKYEINWPDIPSPATATAKTKIIRSEALSLLNSNCL